MRSTAQATASFGYDALGNITSRTLGSRTFGYSYDSFNRLTQHTDTQGSTRNIGYDSRGNITALGSQGFRYDASDRPVALIDNGGEAVDGAYRYDGHGRRVKSIVDDEGDIKTLYNIFDANGARIWVIESDGSDPSENHVSQYVQMDGQNLVRVRSVGGPSEVDHGPVSYRRPMRMKGF